MSVIFLLLLKLKDQLEANGQQKEIKYRKLRSQLKDEKRFSLMFMIK
jgi:hypothetical protein